MGRCRELVGPLVALISLVIGLVVILLAIVYLVYSVELQEITKAKLIMCVTVSAMPKFVSKMALSRKGKERCKFWKHQTAAGALGIIFGCFQILTSIAALLFKKIGWKIWIGVNIFSLLATVAAAALLFYMYAEEDEPEDDKVMLGDMMPEQLRSILPEPLRKLPILPTNLSDPTFILKLGQKFLPTNLQGFNVLGSSKSNDGGEKKQSRSFGLPDFPHFLPLKPTNMMKVPDMSVTNLMNFSKYAEVLPAAMITAQKLVNASVQSTVNLTRSLKISPEELTNLAFLPIKLLANNSLLPPYLKNLTLVTDFFNTLQSIPNMLKNLTNFLPRSLQKTEDPQEKQKFEKEKQILLAYAVICSVDSIFILIALVLLYIFQPWSLARVKPAAADNEPEEKQQQEKKELDDDEDKKQLQADKIKTEPPDKDKQERQPDKDKQLLLPDEDKKELYPEEDKKKRHPDKRKKERRRSTDEHELHPGKVKKARRRSTDEHELHPDEDKLAVEPDEDKEELHPDKVKKARRSTDEQELQPDKVKKARRRSTDKQELHPDNVKKARRRSTDEQERHPDKVKKARRRSTDEQELDPDKVKKERRRSKKEQELPPDTDKKERRHSKGEQELHPGKVKKESGPGKVMYLKVPIKKT